MELQPGQDGYAKAFIAELKSKLKQGKKMPTVDEIKSKYGHEMQNDALNKDSLNAALRETNKEIKDLQRQLKEKMDYAKVLKERIAKAK